MMHDLQLPTEVAPSDDAVRRFRASTVEEAMAAAANELGPSVHIVEANRIRRGGVGGFFATDLGVELVATNATIAQDTSIRIASDLIPGATAPAALGRRPQFDNPGTDPSADSPAHGAMTLDGLERLIADVGRSERDTNHLDKPLENREATSFADHLQRETELPTEPLALPLALPLARRDPMATWSHSPIEPIEPTSRSYAALVRHVDETGWGERQDPIDLDAVHLAWTELVESIEAKSEATSKREWAAATAARLRSRAVSGDLSTAVATTPSTRTRTPKRTPTRTSIRKPLPLPASMPATTAAIAGPENLVASATAHIFEQLASLDTRSGGKLDCLRSLRVAVTMPDGANIEVTADLSLMAGDRA